MSLPIIAIRKCNASSSAFSAAAVKEMRRSGITPCEATSAEPIFYNVDLMTYVSLSEIREDYEEAALDLAEDGVFSLADLIERETAMGGSIREVSAFYVFRDAETCWTAWDEADDDEDYVIEQACEYKRANTFCYEFNIPHTVNAVQVIKVFCPQYAEQAERRNEEAHRLAERLLPFAKTYENWEQYESDAEYIADTADALFYGTLEAEAIVCELECYVGAMWAEADELLSDLDRFLRSDEQ